MWLSLTAASLAGDAIHAQVAPAKPSLLINITGADYREADGTVVLRAVASNSTSRDGVLTAVQLVHISVAPSGDVLLGYKQSGNIPRFKEVIVTANKSVILECASEVDLETFYKDDLEASALPRQQRSNAREGRLFLEVRAIDGMGKTYQNFFRIGTVGVFREKGKYVRPYVITNGKTLDAFEDGDFLAQTRDALLVKNP